MPAPGGRIVASKAIEPSAGLILEGYARCSGGLVMTMGSSSAMPPFLKALSENTDALRLLLAKEWPYFEDLFVSTSERILEAENDAERLDAFDDLMDSLRDSPADAMVVDLYLKTLENEGVEGSASRGEGQGREAETELDAISIGEALELLAGPSLNPEESYWSVPILYATDRACDRKGGYTGERGTLHFGTAKVTIPSRNPIGGVAAPPWWSLRKNDGSRYVRLVETMPRERHGLIEALRAMPAEMGLGRGALVFVHGYNVTFRDAARRLAQMAFDLQLPSVPILYSWPSKGRLHGYTADEESVLWSAPHLRTVLSSLRHEADLRTIDVVAHSMGNRALLFALNLSPPAGAPPPALRNVVLAAPDVDADVFREEIVHVRGCAERVTLYASSEDRALKLSKTIHGYPRAGDSGPGVISLPGTLDTIDASAVDTSLLGHSYYGSRSVLSDLFSLLGQSTDPPRFGMVPVARGTDRYWALRP